MDLAPPKSLSAPLDINIYDSDSMPPNPSFSKIQVRPVRNSFQYLSLFRVESSISDLFLNSVLMEKPCVFEFIDLYK